MGIKTSKKARKLRIAQIVPLWYSLPPKKYAGIERVASYLTEELVKRGHDVTLFASGDSKTSAKLASIRSRCLIKDKISWTDVMWELENLSFAFKKAEDFDVIHSHIGLRALFFQEFTETPVLHTFHNPIYPKPNVFPTNLKIFELHKKTTNACFLSKSAEKLSSVRIKNKWIAYNGIDTELFKFNPNPEDYFLWVGRFDPYKGSENAIKVAEMLKIKLYLAGKIDPEKVEYFRQKIKPRLSSKIKYLGELSQKELVKVYAGAKALIFPFEWNEPFGLTMVEAMSCGTPAVAFNLGSAAEVVNNGKSGFVVPYLDKRGEKNIKGIVDAVRNVKSIKRTDCRAWVLENFALQKMVDNYEKIYYEINKRN